MRLLALVMLAVSLAPGAAIARAADTAQPVAAKVPDELHRFFTDYFRAVEAGDPAGIMTLIDTDFLLRWPSGPAVTDRERLRSLLASLQQRVRQEVEWEVLEGGAGRDWAWARVAETAIHHPKAGGEPRRFTGAHLVILRNVNGRWLLHRDHSALDEPAAPAR